MLSIEKKLLTDNFMYPFTNDKYLKNTKLTKSIKLSPSRLFSQFGRASDTDKRMTTFTHGITDSNEATIGP